MAGYSGTPLPKKLGIKAGFRIALPDISSNVKAELKEAIAGCEIAGDGPKPLDFVLLSVKTQADLKKEFARWAKRLAPAGMLWIAWPKKTSGVASDLDENKVREIGLGVGLVDVKVCAVSEVWSGLKFVIRVKDRFC
jgi:hypothetical protein